MKSSLSQIKKSAESLTKRLDQIEDKISGLKDKVNELEHSNKGKKYEWNMQHLWETIKRLNL
jgi:chromosome segregation ATPase